MEERCVCCGAVIPEGRMVCPACENSEADLTETSGYGELTEKEKLHLLGALQDMQ